MEKWGSLAMMMLGLAATRVRGHCSHRVDFSTSRKAEVMEGMGWAYVFTSLFPHTLPLAGKTDSLSAMVIVTSSAAGAEMCGMTSSRPLVTPELVEKEGLCRGGSGRVAYSCM